MKGRTVFRSLVGIAAGLILLVLIGWLVFVPFPKEPAYQFVSSWGEKGTGPGQFRDPTGIAIAGDDVFVADSRNGRIQVFDQDGHFRRQFGAPGEGLGKLGRPMNLTIHGDEVYVPEYFNDQIQVFSLDGRPKRIIGQAGAGRGEFNAPGGVAVGPNGDLFVADFYNQRVQQLRVDGTFVRQWGATGKVGHGAEYFTYPTDVALARDGRLYVADGYGNRIEVFDSAGAFVSKWGGPFAMGIYGPFNGWFIVVTSVVLDAQGNVFAADFYNHRIQKFRADGTFLTRFGGKGTGPGQFNHAIAVAVANNGALFAADFGNNRTEKWRPRR